MTFPLLAQPEWSIYDSSKLDTYIACPRKFFYEHILGWRRDLPAHDLYFGQAWHIAREHQLLYGYDQVDEAFTKFLQYYRLQFDESTDDMYKPKNPMGVLNALLKFYKERSNDLIENEVVELNGVKLTEISGTVPIGEKRRLHYKMDSHMRRRSDGKIFSWDHKSTSGKYINNDFWSNQFYLSIQNGTYTHCLYCQYPIEQVLGIEFCGTGFEFLSKGSAQRSAGYHATLRRVPAFKNPSQMNIWLWTVNDIVDDLERDMDRLFHSSIEDPVLMAFRCNSKSCGDYRGCTFHDFCMSWTNPLQRCAVPPLGYRVEFWNPEEAETKIKQELNFPQ
jgi:hypothetical protein